MVKDIERQARQIRRRHFYMAEAHTFSPCRTAPIGDRRWQRDVRRERHIMLRQLIKTFVIERSHQLSLCRLSVRIHDGERPFLLLTRNQAVTEGLPLQMKFHIRNRTHDGSLIRISLSVLHPSIQEHQSVAVFLLVGKLTVDKCVRLIHRSALKDVLAGKNGIDNMHILV